MKRLDGKFSIDGDQIIKTSNGEAIPDPQERMMIANDFPTYPYLSHEFLTAMNDLIKLGYERHGENSFHGRRLQRSHERNHLRFTEVENFLHASEHWDEYRQGQKHEQFKTLGHQLAAVAVNAMMEFYFAGLDNEPK